MRRNLPTSSRENPNVNWVRSLVPNEKNCASSATSPAVMAARGTSIMVPTRYSTWTPFFSFGTNDLTQTTFGLSRDDASSFLGGYATSGILASDPFVTLDIEGVGELMQIAADRGRETRPDIKLGICGEHGGDPASVAFCHEVGLDYVSCSPFRVPIARLAAAQASLKSTVGRAAPSSV